MALLTFGTRTDADQEEDAYKICPVCGARVFDDMGICYGCLYVWPEEEDAGEAEDGFAPSVLPGFGLRVRTPYADFTLPVPEEGLSIGRSPGNSLVIHSKTVAREHARVMPAPDGLQVELLDGAAASIDGVPVAGSAFMGEGQILDIADASFVAVAASS
ncbi:MAG: FHA domain-containing protein [Eggerthellaceae bacterium]|nr:FHA domain-containing protein [Eggerthellaceae bacterium]